MTKERQTEARWVIESDGHNIISLADWEKHAGPKSPKHWKPGRSAYECAASWFGRDGRPAIPVELTELLRSSGVTDDAKVLKVLPEHRVRFDDLPGEPRNADVNVIAEGRDGRIAISIEAKADEPFGERVSDVLESAVRKIATDQPSNAVLRVQQLAASVFGKGAWERLPLGDVRYQLLTGIAGALAFAREEKASVAVFVVHEFVTEQTEDEKHLQNLRDLNAFVERLTRGRMNALRCTELVGPIAYPGSPLFRGGEQPALYLGKMRRVTRANGALGVFGVPAEQLEQSCEPSSEGQDWRDGFDDIRPYAHGEGGGVYLAQKADDYFVVTSQGALADLLDEELPSAYVRRFDSAMARAVWCAERYGRLRLA